MLTSDTIIHFKRNAVNSITKVPASYVVLQVHYLLVSYLSSVDIVQPPQGLRTTHKHINICLICLLHHLSHWCCITREGLGAYYISSRLAWHLLNSGLTLHGLPIKIVQRIFTRNAYLRLLICSVCRDAILHAPAQPAPYACYSNLCGISGII